MPYISFAQHPGSIGVGRQARNSSYEEDTRGNFVAEVDEVLPGETEIDAATFAIMTAANGSHNAAIPPVVIAPLPDVMGFLGALFADPLVGRNVARKLNRDYSDGLRALEQGRWGAARLSILDAKNNIDPTLFTLTAPMYDQIVVLLAQFNIPLA